MIPLRLMLENFMCYYEKTEINFRGSAIWALSGHNGAGKSTIFDAMRYALYGEHRAGKQRVEALIHRGITSASFFTIEFDFAVGANEYRIRRTYSRQKRGTTQAFYLAGPDAPTPGRPGPQPIPGTEKDGLEEWVVRTIRLNEQAFTVSVLLLQGQSDKLLKLKGSERHEVLAHIIDLKRYGDLANRALKEQKEQEQSVRIYKGQLDSLELIDESSVASLEQQAREAQQKKEQARQSQLDLTILKEQASRWQKLQTEEKPLLLEIKRIDELLMQTEQIECDMMRFTSLQQIIRPMTQLQLRQQESADLQQQIKQRCEQMLPLEAHIQRLSNERQKAQSQLEVIRASYQEQDQEQKAIQKQLLDLQIPCNEIDLLRRKQYTAQDLNNALTAFDATLDQQQQELMSRIGEIGSIEKAIPLLISFAQRRDDWLTASRELVQIAQELYDQEKVREQSTSQLQALDRDREISREQVGKRQSEVASQRALLVERQERVDRFHTIESGAVCDYCGQQLTSEHLDTERLRLQQILQQQESCVQECEFRYREAQQQQKIIDQKRGNLLKEQQQQQQNYEELIKKQNIVERQRDTAAASARTQLELLAPAYLIRIQGSESTQLEVSLCLKASYPTSQDLTTLGLQVRDKSELQQKLQTVEEALAQRQELQHQRHYLLGEIESLLQSYPPELATRLVEEQEQAR